ncbi:MAG: ABC transporter ATP-binding protein [Chloroflexi bacterium CG23_combo_of_CG06-09_8_20_14_all_45_10]|nr:MAG: ABC transporter ATP-binding protein [Chloroflexi bacterium CG23_combo_of_CG06-09_8_20_14_all_45_10]
MSAFFEVENLTKRFGDLVAVDNFSFKIRRDEIVGLIGPNGSGKSTLVHCILGILKPDSGKVRLYGKDITNHHTWDIVNKGIAGTFQVVKPFRHLPVIANVMVACLCPRSGKTGEWVKRVEMKANDALEFTGIADLALRPASILSHGDLKRLEIARVIATIPELLFLDEPFGGLNPAETDLIGKSIKRLHKGGRFGRLHSEGPAMLIIEHKLADLMKIIDRVIVMNFGKLIAEGTPEEIVKNPEVQKAYLGREVSKLAS